MFNRSIRTDNICVKLMKTYVKMTKIHQRNKSESLMYSSPCEIRVTMKPSLLHVKIQVANDVKIKLNLLNRNDYDDHYHRDNNCGDDGNDITSSHVNKLEATYNTTDRVAV